MSTEANAGCLNEAAVMMPLHPEEMLSVAEGMQRALLLSTAPSSTPLPIHEGFSMGGWRRRAPGCPQGPLDVLGPSSSRFPRTSAAKVELWSCAECGLKGLKGTLGYELQLLKGKFKGPHTEISWSQCEM